MIESGGKMMSLRSARATARVVSIALPVQLYSVACGYAQQSTGLISSGFNPIAATTPAMVDRLMSIPPNQFQLRQKDGRPYYVYADPSGCTCAYVGSVAAMNKYRASYGALPADALPSDGSANLEQEMMNSMENDDAGAQFNKDVFGPDF
jgi:hypothetical protein